MINFLLVSILIIYSVLLFGWGYIKGYNEGVNIAKRIERLEREVEE